jgi:hypothetical protein
VFHVFNRGAARMRLFRKDAAFERTIERTPGTTAGLASAKPCSAPEGASRRRGAPLPGSRGWDGVSRGGHINAGRETGQLQLSASMALWTASGTEQNACEVLARSEEQEGRSGEPRTTCSPVELRTSHGHSERTGTV